MKGFLFVCFVLSFGKCFCQKPVDINYSKPLGIRMNSEYLSLKVEKEFGGFEKNGSLIKLNPLSYLAFERLTFDEDVLVALYRFRRPSSTDLDMIKVDHGQSAYDSLITICLLYDYLVAVREVKKVLNYADFLIDLYKNELTADVKANSGMIRRFGSGLGEIGILCKDLVSKNSGLSNDKFGLFKSMVNELSRDFILMFDADAVKRIKDYDFVNSLERQNLDWQEIRDRYNRSCGDFTEKLIQVDDDVTRYFIEWRSRFIECRPSLTRFIYQ